MTEAGRSPEPEPTVTREVRWFFDGPIPPDVKMWFTDYAKRGVRETRTDVYDRGAAHDGIGIKRRDGAVVDEKRRLGDPETVELLPGVTGCVEDWVKTPKSGLAVGRDQVVVTKEIITVTFDHPDSPEDETIGCEAELASVRVGPNRSWSLCFETYGDPGLRDEALQFGIRGLLGSGPLPASLRLSASTSCGYPAWISRLDTTD